MPGWTAFASIFHTAIMNITKKFLIIFTTLALKLHSLLQSSSTFRVQRYDSENFRDLKSRLRPEIKLKLRLIKFREICNKFLSPTRNLSPTHRLVIKF